MELIVTINLCTVFCRNTLPDLLPSNHLLNHTTSRHQQSSFPVNVIQNRVGSPTKSIHGSNSSSSSLVGRRSPIHEQMDIISELTEDPTSSTPAPPVTNHTHHHHSPPSPRSLYTRRSSLGAETSILQFRRGNMVPLTSNNRQRRTGAISPALHAQITANLSEEQKQSLHRRASTENGGATCMRAYLQKRRNSDQPIPVSTSKTHQNLKSHLQMPLFNPQLSPPQQQQQQQKEVTVEQKVSKLMHPQNGQSYSEVVYTNGFNHYNTQLSNGYQGMMQPPVITPNHVTSLPQAPHSNEYNMSIEGMLSHVSSVLNSCRIPYQHSNGVFSLEYQGVHLRILICNFPCSIQLQYVAGDTVQYERVCTQLYNQLRYTPLIPTQKMYTTVGSVVS